MYYEVYVDTNIFPALVLETASLHKAVTKFNELVTSYKTDDKWKDDEFYGHLSVEVVAVNKHLRSTSFSWQQSSSKAA